MPPTLTTLESLNSTDAYPEDGLIADASGNLFGTTYKGGAGDGTVFEIAKTEGVYSSTSIILSSFNGTDGSEPNDLIADASGNLFGTTEAGANGDGTVFEIAKTEGVYSSAPTVLASFNGADGSEPNALIADASGNLFGTAYAGGANGAGTVFEIAKTDGGYSSTPTVLASFNSTDGAYPDAALIADASGNLFGTTQQGGGGDGTVFEIAKTDGGYSSTPTVLASFNSTDGAYPDAALIADASGNLFGTTVRGGANDDGTVFEITKTNGVYSSTPSVLASFDGSDGRYPVVGLIADAAGNLFGTTYGGGDNSDGTVFEITKTGGAYSSTPSVLASFDNSDGTNPYAGLIADASGNLFGTTQQGGGGYGTVFEVTDSGFVPASVACYCRGTLIATDHGPLAIEALAIGDMLVTASGAHRPVKWLGHRRLDPTRHPDLKAVWPVRVSAGAFGKNLPVRDLWLSPGHNVFTQGVLMPIVALVNGATIVQVPVNAVTYWHVELDSHDVILAEGLPAESYLDTGNRTAFANGGAFIEANPDFKPKHWAETCAPLMKTGPDVAAAKAALLARAQDLGYETSAAHDLHIVADGERIEPITLGDRRFAFAVPRGGRRIALASRSFVPSQMTADNIDDRVLGVCVKRLQLDGVEVDLGDTLADDWHEPEHKPTHVQRWTTGRTVLPPGTRIVFIDLAGDGIYWVERRDNIVALVA